MSGRPAAVARAAGRGFHAMARGGLRGIWTRGDLPAGPFVWASNHHSWWDPFVAALLLDRAQRRAGLLMRQDNQQRFDFTRRLGTFAHTEPRRGLAHLAAGHVLVIFPEGELRHPGPPGPLAAGAAWYARRAGVPLCAVAVRILLRAHQAPEAYVSARTVTSTGDRAEVTRELAASLGAQLADIDAAVTTAHPEEPLPGFTLAVTGRRDWNERIDAVTRWRPWAR